jgi:predicted regulator of Ras-like GTPase activity (Roadblock/LC7/MglB family)
MLFFDTIKRLVDEIPHASGCIMVDRHGDEIITFAPENDFQMKLLGAHMVLIHQKLAAIERRMETGKHREVFIRTDNIYVITTQLPDGNYLVLRLSPTPLISLSMDRLRKASVDIIEEAR